MGNKRDLHLKLVTIQSVLNAQERKSLPIQQWITFDAPIPDWALSELRYHKEHSYKASVFMREDARDEVALRNLRLGGV